MRDEDRYLRRRGRRWHYVRRVPVDLVAHYGDPLIRKKLKTSDLAEARLRRDKMEAADDAYWDDLRLEGKASDQATRRYHAACNRALAMSYKYLPANELAETADLSELIKRIKDVSTSAKVDKAEADALLGRVDMPAVRLMDVFKVVKDEVRAEEIGKKDKEAKTDWEKGKLRSIEMFVEMYGDLPIDQIDRSVGRQFYNHWKDRVIGVKGDAVTGNYANRHIGNLRSILNDYWDHLGEDHDNPFSGFSFSNKSRSKRKPLDVEQISRLFLQPGAFQNMNREARLILYMLIETGARLSEIATMDAEDFVLDGDYPHILIFERDGRGVKNNNSNRIVPLVGVSLEAAKLAKDDGGFPHYRPCRKSLSTALNKFCRENGFFEEGQSVYSLRHTFEDRMKEADIDGEMRKYLMGHAIDRQEYGAFASLKKKWEAVKAIELPYNDEIFKGIC